MSKTLTGIASAIAIILFGLFVFSFVQETRFANASAPSGLPATVATSSTIAVGTSTKATILFAGDGTCSARIITTYAQPVMLSFAAVSSTTISQTVGHLQAASTTVVYDSGLYGCGLFTAIGEVYSTALASTTITLTETQ